MLDAVVVSKLLSCAHQLQVCLLLHACKSTYAALAGAFQLYAAIDFSHQHEGLVDTVESILSSHCSVYNQAYNPCIGVAACIRQLIRMLTTQDLHK